MANQILNATTAGVNPATYAGQARPDKGDTDVWAAAVRRTGVVSGCAVSQRAWIAPTLRASLHNSATEAASKTVTIPSAVVTGDMMLIATLLNGTSSLTTPTGWTALTSAVTSGNADTVAKTQVFWKVAVSGDTGGATVVTLGGGSNVTQVIFEAWANGTAINVSGFTASTADGVAMTSPSVTTTTPNCAVVEFWTAVCQAGGGEAAFTVLPATIDVTSVTSEAFFNVAATSQVATLSGATPSKSASNSGSPNGSWVGYTVAITGNSTAAMAIDVAGGSVLISGASVTVPASTGIVITAAHATLDRIDVVSVDSTGVPIVTTGTAAATPNWPAVTTIAAGTAVCLATVYVQATAAAVLNANIVDKREVLGVIHAEADRLFLVQASPARRGLNAGLGQVPRPPILYPARIASRSTFR